MSTMQSLGFAGTLMAAVLLSSAPIGFAASDTAKITTLEQVPFKYGLGQQKYTAMCAECHGKWLRGTDQGPPLLHGYYKPSHHGDRSFYRAILQGTQQHHWNFGDMAPVPGATQADAQQIIPFVRWVQQAEGLY
ncbi:MAG: cytochrome c [Gammaproteobacteria bacterium]|nr:cytochrome c [Gammaproteobacteria bacterium]